MEVPTIRHIDQNLGESFCQKFTRTPIAPYRFRFESKKFEERQIRTSINLIGYDIMTAHIDEILDTRSNKAWKKWTNGLHEQVKVHGYKDVKGYLHSIESDASNSYRRSTVHSDVVHSGLKNVSSVRAVSSLQ